MVCAAQDNSNHVQTARFNFYAPIIRSTEPTEWCVLGRFHKKGGNGGWLIHPT